MIRNPLISVVVPIYNSELFLAETIDSIINQDVGFMDNIEVVLIDDGSTDRSIDICNRYIKKYRNNIRLESQKNSGVSAARNLGLSLARGKYINFLDSDDKWPKDAYRKLLKFLDSNCDKIDFVAARVRFFDKSMEHHHNNYKFNKTRVLYVDLEPDSPILHVSSCMFLKSSLQGKLFDTNLPITEDARFISDVLVKKRAYGVISNTDFYYRKRQDGSSAIDGKFNKKEFYNVVPKLAYMKMLDDWRDESGYVAKFMQNEIFGDLIWRLDQPKQEVLNDREIKDYKNVVYGIIKQFDDDVIINKKTVSAAYKAFCLRVKYGDKKYNDLISLKNDSYYFGDKKIISVDDFAANIDFIESVDGKLAIEGSVSTFGVTDLQKSVLQYDGHEHSLSHEKELDKEIRFFDDVVYGSRYFKVKIEPARRTSSLSVQSVFKGHSSALKIKTNYFTGLSGVLGSYKLTGNVIVKKGRNKIKIYRRSLARTFIFEVGFIFGIFFNWRIKEAAKSAYGLYKIRLRNLPIKKLIFELVKPFLIIAESIVKIPRDIIIRLLYWARSPFVKKPIWIISDRAMAAGDNGEALFRHISKLDHLEHDIYFAISKKSEDYERLKKYGKILNHGSFFYKLKFLLADKIISSHADIEVINPFIRQADRFSNLYNFKFVFLQHGVIRNDLSSWLNKYERNIDLFITAGKKEYDSIFKYPYYYEKHQVALTGLPRYDLLKNKPAGKLIIAPTYRNNLLVGPTNKYGVRGYDHEFKKSDYFNFYNRLINDPRLVKLLKKHKMTGEFYIHPNFAAQIKDFKAGQGFVVAKYPYSYSSAFESGNLLITDYSSVVFDFAYLNKPVIYSQFDKEQFFRNQIYAQGDFFDDEKDGFGPVVYDYESLVNETISLVESGAVMSDLYRKRVRKFFKWFDQNNSHRVFERIKSLK